MSQLKDMKLYDLLLVVELQLGDKGQNVPFISYRYPSLFEVDPFSASVTQFCFPDIGKFPTVAMPKETFSFVLTEGDGERRFGYCLRKMPPGTEPRYPVAYSIMTFFPCFPLYSKILEAMAYYYENCSMSNLTEFVDSVLKQQMPLPGKTFSISMQGNTYNFTRPDDSDSLLEHINLDTLLTSLSERNILIVFTALLIERRIIFCSEQLSTLSSCIQTAVALVYPFTWQHIYIPVLPKSLLSFVCAPMPFVVGVLRTDLDEVLRNPMDEVLLIDIDNGNFILSPTEDPGEDLDKLPAQYTENLLKLLKSSSKQIKRVQKRRKDRRTEDDLQKRQTDYEMQLLKKELTAAFIAFFVELIGKYRKYMNNGKFEKEAFLKSQPEDVQPFLELLATSQMFEIFIQEKLADCSESGFEKKITQSEQLKAQMEKLGGTVSSRKPKKKTGGWSTLRNQFKRDQPTTMSDNTFIGSPTLVTATTERTGSKIIPTVPPKPKPLPKFIVPTKPLPTAPNRGLSSSKSSTTISRINNSRLNVVPSTHNPKRNTWLPSTSTPSFLSQSPPVPNSRVKPPPRVRGRGRGFGGRQRPVSVRPGEVYNQNQVKPTPPPRSRDLSSLPRKPNNLQLSDPPKPNQRFSVRKPPTRSATRPKPPTRS